MTPNHPTDNPETEQIKARSRAEHRQSIIDTMDKARLARQHYDEQLREHGEIGRELHADLGATALRLFSLLRPYRDEVASFPDMTDVRNSQFDHGGHVADNPAAPAKLFAAYIDALEAIATQLGFAEVGDK